MRLKSYFAASVDAAMQQARRELGEEAMLLDSRAAAGESRHTGRHEVIFALPDYKPSHSGEENGQPSSRKVAGERLPQAEDPDTLTDDLAALRREIHQMRETVARTTSHSAPSIGIESNTELSRFYDLFLSRDVCPEVTQRILTPCARSESRDATNKSTRRSIEAMIREQIGAVLRARPEFDTIQGKGNGCQRLLLFVGPPGSGKTSALVKLAMNMGLASRKPLLILSVDNYRVASSEQLRAYACILGVTFQHVETVQGVHSILEEHRHKHWVFIDTPGCGPNETEVIQELSQLSKLNNEMETQLVLSAAMRTADLKVAVKRFSPFNAGKLLFTHLDETQHTGGVLSAAVWSGKPVSFLSSGQRIPEDLEAATSEKLMDLVLPDLNMGRPRAAARSNQAGTVAAGC